MPRFKITAQFLKNGLICPPGKDRIEYIPEGLPGLYILVTAASPGQGTYFLRFKQAGTQKTQHIKIGRTTEISYAEACKRFTTLKGEISTGADPYVEEKARKAVITLDEFFNTHYLPYVKPRKRSWKRDEELYRLRIKDVFGHLRLNLLDRKSIQTFHASLLKKNLAPASADHHIKLIRYALNLAVEWEMLEANPAKGIKLFNVDNKVEHYLNGEQLERLLHVLRTDANRTVCFICMWLLSTGARLNEALQATHSQIDVANRIWRIPAANSKSKRLRAVPLNDSALFVLEQLDGQEEHLFINRLTKQPYTTVMKVWDRLRTKADLSHIRIHDLRHCFASMLINDKRSLYEVQCILGHSDPKVTARYSHLHNATLQEAANSASVLVKSAKATEAA